MKLRSTEPIEFKFFDDLKKLSNYQSTQLCKVKCNFCENYVIRELWYFLKKGNIVYKCKQHSKYPILEKKSFEVKNVEDVERLLQSEPISKTKIRFTCSCGKTIERSLSKFKEIMHLKCNICKGYETIKNKYGVENVSKLDFVKSKKAETCKKNFGVENPSQSKIVRDRKVETWRKNFGADHCTQSKDFFKGRKTLYNYENEKFDSSWELALWIYAKDHNEEIEREPCSFEYEFEGKKHSYYPDFKYKGQLVEVKSDRLFQLMQIENTQLNEKLKCGLKNNVEFFTCSEMQPFRKYILATYGREYLKQFKRN